MFQLDNPVIVSIALVISRTVSRHLVLEVHFSDGRPDVVRVKAFASGNVKKPDLHKGTDVLKRFVCIVGLSGRNPSDIHDTPVVVGVAVRIKGDLLLLLH